MKVKNFGSGIHSREIKGIQHLQKALPDEWMAFTNLEFVINAGKSREIDLILISPLRIFLIDLKDWNGEIESRDGDWYQNKIYRGRSPVTKISENARDVGIAFSRHLREYSRKNSIVAPKIEGLIIITGDANTNRISPSEKQKVFSLHQFQSVMKNQAKERATFGDVASTFLKENLLSSDWKNKINQFFNVSKGTFEPGQKRFAEFKAVDRPEFSHPNNVYKEFQAQSTTSERGIGTLRIWDFTEADTRFQNEDERLRIAGREKRIGEYIREIDDNFDSYHLRTKAEDIEFSPNYWEVYDRRIGLERLDSVLPQTFLRLAKPKRISLCQQLLSRISKLHQLKIAHLDLGAHSVWYQDPGQVKISHFMAAAIPNQEALGDDRNQFLSATSTPEELMGVESTHETKDVFLLGLLVHKILFGKIPTTDRDGLVNWTNESVTETDCSEFSIWFERALSHEPAIRYPSALEALEHFKEISNPASLDQDNRSVLEKFSHSRIKSAFNLYNAFPPLDEPIIDTIERTDWISQQDNTRVRVHTWKSACWSSIDQDGSKILQFLNQIKDIKERNIPNLPKIHDIVWVAEQIVVVTEYVDGNTIEDILNGPDISINTAKDVSTKLLELVETLHAHRIFHGNLSPCEVIFNEGMIPSIALEGLLRFGTDDNASIDENKYTLSEQTPQKNDRYACIKIVEKLLRKSNIADKYSEFFQNLDNKLDDAQSLSDLCDMLTASATIAAKKEELRIDNYWGKAGKLPKFIPDEGRYYITKPEQLTKNKHGHYRLYIIGATAALSVFFDKERNISKVFYDVCKQSFLENIKRFQSGVFDGAIKLRHGEAPNFKNLSKFLSSYELFISEHIPANVETNEHETSSETFNWDETTYETLAELVAQQSAQYNLINTKKIWETLLSIEENQVVLAISEQDSEYDNRSQNLLIPCEINTTLDYSNEDIVLVEKFIPRQDRWEIVGELDLEASSNKELVVSTKSEKFLKINTKLRLKSRFEAESLKRRLAASARLTQKRCANSLIGSALFGTLKVPDKIFTDVKKVETAAKKYGLNSPQTQSLKNILSARPLGLLQGPPGTGKTKFIAALVHYALLHGLARNVLIASQSHEAVNNAADAIIDHFEHEDIDFLRIGREAQITGELKKFGSRRLIDEKKAQFSSDIETKVDLASKFFEIPKSTVRKILNIEGYFPRLTNELFLLRDRSRNDRNFTRKDSEKLERFERHLSATLREYQLDGHFNAEFTEADPESFLRLVREKLAAHFSITQLQYDKLVHLQCFMADYKNSIEMPERNFESFLAATKMVVAGTCVGLGKNSLGLTTTTYDLVVVDEAARCAPSELAVPLQTAKWAVLVGDQLQLEPMHDTSIISGVKTVTQLSEGEIIASDFEKIFDSEYGRQASGILSTQYRMLPSIGELVSKTFYQQNLNNGRSDPLTEWDTSLPCLSKPCTWISTDDLGKGAFETTKGKSRINVAEAKAIVNLIKGWETNEHFSTNMDETNYEFPIGVICMYGAQRDYLRKTMANSGIDPQIRRKIKIDTVDSYQGKENPIVIVSLVRNNNLNNGKIAHGFLARPNRINVAVSRARDRLILVGAQKNWSQETSLAALAENFSSLEASKEAETVSTNDLVTYLLKGN